MSNIHLCGKIRFSTILSILYLFTVTTSVEITQLTFCGSSTSENSDRSLVFVSTLDGKISALDAANHGKTQWTFNFGEGPMLSSSIHRRELNNNGQWVRLIPSLGGGLYKFDGENLEAIPISSDQLLHSSFRYSDDLVFSGGKETKSYGVSSNTGHILYECSINGCTNNTDGESYIEQDILVIQRYQQTVRAVESRTGAERWNFSVGQHDLTLLPRANAGCQNNVSRQMLDIDIKVIVPEGLIWAVNKSNPTVKLWQHKFDAPIVTIWREDGNRNTNDHGLKKVNLFDGSQWRWGSEYPISPSIYLGMHDRQLYVQESTEFYKVVDSSQKFLQQARYPWKPYPATSTAIAPAMPSTVSNDNNLSSVTMDDAQSTTALSVLYSSEYINGNGFYLYSKSQMQLESSAQCNGTHPDLTVVNDSQKPTLDYMNEADNTPVQIIIVSLWYWWKEVLIISFTTAILLNCVLTQRLLSISASKDAKDVRPIVQLCIVENHVDGKKETHSLTDGHEDIKDFKSRYLTDFEPVDCLGKGGYGVVFEAKNKIDDCNYAIKRIALPNSQDSRERVMREVKALAKLDHHNIVRYFNAWLECPPAGWQEEHDQQWIDKFLSSDFTSEMSQNETKHNSVCIDVSQTEHSSAESACEPFKVNHCKNEESFIIFGRSDKSRNDEEAISIGDCSTQDSDLSNCESTDVPSNNVSDCSDSIVFEQKTTRNQSEKEKTRGKKASFSLDLSSKITNRKSTKMFLYIQMQLCQRLSLREWLKQQSMARDTRRVLDIFYQIVDAVEYVHLQGLIHRDLKPSNIFFAYDDTIKIGDFGLVTAMTEGYEQAHTPTEPNENITLKNSLHTACVGTHLYMSPEQMNGQNYNYKVDIYSLGIILFELLIPFSTEMERIIVLTNLRKSTFPQDFDRNYPAEFELLKMMLDMNPDKRPTTLGIKARPPLSNYDTANGLSINESSKWHFELPQLIRHSSVTSSNSSSNESWENIN